MIAVVAINGESYELLTGKQRPKTITLSNGISTVDVEVSEETVEAVVRMTMELQSQQVEQAQTNQVEAPDLGIVRQTHGGNGSENTVRPTAPRAPIHEEEEREVGEVYSDPVSGTQSI